MSGHSSRFALGARALVAALTWLGLAQAQSETDDVFAEVERELAPPSEPAATKPTAVPARAAAPAPAAPRSGALMNPELSIIGSFAGALYSRPDHLQTGGHDPERSGFNLQALELNARSAVDPYFRLEATLAFGPDEVEVEEAYGSAVDLPGGLGARFGQLLTRLGRVNAQHLHAWTFVDQPFAIGRVFGAEGNRGLGVEASWLTPLPWYVELVGTVMHAEGAETARSFLGEGDRTVESPADLLYVATLEQFFSLSQSWSLLWGLSGALGPNLTGEQTAVYGTDLYLRFRPLESASSTVVTWQTEVLHRRYQTDQDELWDVTGYTQLFWQFARRWGAGARYEYGSPTFDLAGASGPDPTDPSWTDSRHRVALLISHQPTEFSRLRLQGATDRPGWRDQPIWAAFLSAELVIGAHGAHQF